MEQRHKLKFIVHCRLSAAATGCAEKAQIFDLDRTTLRRTTFHRLIDGDYLAIKLQIERDRRPISVSLARVLWIQGERLGVELLVMDADERSRLKTCLETDFSLELEFQETRSELIIHAAE